MAYKLWHFLVGTQRLEPRWWYWLTCSSVSEWAEASKDEGPGCPVPDPKAWQAGCAYLSCSSLTLTVPRKDKVSCCASKHTPAFQSLSQPSLSPPPGLLFLTFLDLVFLAFKIQLKCYVPCSHFFDYQATPYASYTYRMTCLLTLSAKCL